MTAASHFTKKKSERTRRSVALYSPLCFALKKKRKTVMLQKTGLWVVLDLSERGLVSLDSK
jgi:hypothetical protein